MESPTARIDVYAQLPVPVTSGTGQDADSNWDWVYCLSFPIEKLNALQFSHKPFKWIRFAIGSVLGEKGDLCTSQGPNSLVDYDAVLPEESISLYYYASLEERLRMFPADPNIGRTHVTSSAHTTRRINFRSSLISRDGGTCVLSGYSDDLCDSVHLLAHSKGNEYITTYTERRSQNPNGVIDDIDSIRNGLLLNKFTHSALGEHVAFLATPNFALNTNDIDPTAPPAEIRCTAHLFVPGKLGYLGGPHVPLGSPLRIARTNDWPPTVIFDAVYAGAVLQHFATQEFPAILNSILKDPLHRDGAMTSAGAEYQAIKDKRNDTKQREEAQEKTREKRIIRRKGTDILDMIMSLPLTALPQNERKAIMIEAEKKAEAAEAAEYSRVQEKVSTWMKQVSSV